MANETILVTGVTGQVGRRLVPRLLSWREPGDAVRALVRTREAAERFEALGAQAVVGDITKAKRELGWQPSRDLATQIDDTLRWRRKMAR